MKRKYRIKSKVRFTAFITILFLCALFAGGGVLGVYDVASLSDKPCTEIYIQSGDTLWDLAQVYGPQNKDVRQVVRAICQINEITPQELHPGQTILIPEVI